MPQDALGLYIHIPICRRKCPYCHFYVLPDSVDHQRQLIDGLRLEWQRYQATVEQQELVSLYFGGGTPALLQPDLLEEILSWIPFPSTTEVTIEANPEDVSPDLLSRFRRMGINRLSMGVQSLDDKLLKHLGRHHSAQQSIDAVHMAKQAGFDNITIDLMYEVPHQTPASWQETLNVVATLPITHLSLYNLVFEPSTVFFKHRAKLQPTLPSQEASATMYQTAIDTLASAGLIQYEISAFARDQQISLHNTGYWLGRPFIGLGPSAFSYYQGERFQNCCNLRKYLKELQSGNSPVDYREKLPEESAQRELFAVALRLNQGVDLKDFEKKNKSLPADVYRTLDALSEQGLIEKEGDRIRMTSRGRLFYDTIASELV